MSKPMWMRRQIACPDCGFVYHNEHSLGDATDAVLADGVLTVRAVNCPRCKAHYTDRDFWAEQQEKWSREMKEE